MEQSSRAVEGPLECTVVPQRTKLPPPKRLEPGSSPDGLVFLPAGVTWQELDADLHSLSQRYRDKARAARAAAKAYRARGDLVRWRKSNAVARAYELAEDALWMLACPF